MSSIGGLLTRLHQQAWHLDLTPGPGSRERQLDEQLFAWRPLARAAQRALQNLPVPADSAARTRATSLQQLLHPLAAGLARESEGRGEEQLASMALVVGAIADLLAGGPPDESRHQLASAALLANLVAPLHVAARCTHTLTDGLPIGEARRALRRLVVASEPYARVPPGERVSPLEHQGLPDADEPGLDGAVRRWAAVAGEVLASEHRVTGYALQVVAGDLSILCRAASRDVVAAGQAGFLGRRLAAQTAAALGTAATAWANATRWPDHLRLGGRTPGLRDASNQLITACTDTPTPPGPALADALASKRVAVQLAVPIAELHTRMLEALAHGHGLWVAGAVIPDVTDAPEVNRARHRSGWTREPDFMSEGLPLHRASQDATTALHTATAFLDLTSRPHPRSQPRRLALVHDRLYLAPTPRPGWETIEPPTAPDRLRSWRPTAGDPSGRELGF